MKHNVLLIPSLDDERKFENIEEYKKAYKFAKNNKGITYIHRSFNSSEEGNAYIEGYLAGIGFLGEGIFYKNYI